jgi:hypothetical protein
VSDHQLGWQDNGDEAHEVSLGVEKKERNEDDHEVHEKEEEPFIF